VRGRIGVTGIDAGADTRTERGAARAYLAALRYLDRHVQHIREHLRPNMAARATAD